MAFLILSNGDDDGSTRSIGTRSKGPPVPYISKGLLFLVSLLNGPCKVLLRESEGVRGRVFVSRGNEKDVFFFFFFLSLDREPLRGPLARRSSSLVEESSRFEIRGDVRTREIFMEKGISF